MPVVDYRQFIDRDLPIRERACPRCASTDAIRIIYGLPDHDLFAASQRGEVALGGCIIGYESPDYECGTCGSALPWVAPDD